MRKSEAHVLLEMLPAYFEHVQAHPHTLLTRFFGVHRITPVHGRAVSGRGLQRAPLLTLQPASHIPACGRPAPPYSTLALPLIPGSLASTWPTPPSIPLSPSRPPQVRFVVMANIFVTDLQIHRRFDIKGSTEGRTIGEEARRKAEGDPTVIFKVRSAAAGRGPLGC
jgi:hypothetical protein